MLPVFSKSSQAIFAAPFSSRLSRIYSLPPFTVCVGKKGFMQSIKKWIERFAPRELRCSAPRELTATAVANCKAMPCVVDLFIYFSITNCFSRKQFNSREPTAFNSRRLCRQFTFFVRKQFTRKTVTYRLYVFYIFVAVFTEQIRHIAPIFLDLYVRGQENLSA